MRKTYAPVVQHNRVILSLTDDTAIEGILWDERGEILVIRDAIRHVPSAPSQPLDGEILVERRRLDYAQVLK